MGYPPGGGSRAIGKLRPSRLVAGPYNDDDVAVQRGIWRRQRLETDDPRANVDPDTGLLVAPALASLLHRTEVRHRDSGISTLELSRP